MGPPSERCHPLLEDADLGAATPQECRRQVTARAARAEPGTWDPRAAASRDGGFGLLVLEGLLMREVIVAERSAAKLLGPGDMLMPHDEAEDPPALPSEVRWTALAPARVAVLDAAFARAVSPWPGVASDLMRRALTRTHAFAFHDAIMAHVRVDERLLMLLWHLAQRFGRVHGDGVHLPLPVTHEALGKFVGAARPSVTTALAELTSAGLVQRNGSGFVLSGSLDEHQRFLSRALSASS